MATHYKKKHAWQEVRFREGVNYIEAYESKLGETALVLLLTVGPIVGLAVYLLMANPIDEFVVIMIGMLEFMFLVAMLILHRPPRRIRIYTDEHVMQRSRILLAWPIFSKWFDLEQQPLDIKQIQVQGEAESGALATLGCLSMVLGPLGLIVYFAMKASSKNPLFRAYALTQPGVAQRPIAVFLLRSEAAKLAAYSRQSCFTQQD